MKNVQIFVAVRNAYFSVGTLKQYEKRLQFAPTSAIPR